MPKPRPIEEYKSQRETARSFDDQGRAVVLRWVEENFDVEAVAVRSVYVTGLPGAVKVEDDSGDSLLAWYDCFSGGVRWR